MSLNRPARCPVCRKPTQSEFRPFCSKGCRDRDFLSWTGEAYRVPGPAVNDTQDSDPEFD